MVFSTNSLGRRGPEPTNGSCPVVFLGDSYTMGYGVNDGEEFPQVVGRILETKDLGQDFEIMNAGIGNSGNGHWLKFVSTKGETIMPAFVVLQFSFNDFDDNLREGCFGLSADGDLVEHTIKVPFLRRVESVVDMVPGLSSSHLFACLRESIFRYFRQRGPDRPDEICRYCPLDGKAAGEYVSADGLAGFALTKTIVESTLTQLKSLQVPHLVLAVGLSEKELFLMSLLFDSLAIEPVVVPSKDARPDLYYRIDGHWNKSGHTFVADRIWGYIYDALNSCPPSEINSS